MNDADLCRRNGWLAGTHLVGDEGYGPTIIKITAVGERYILARTISHGGNPVDEYESLWTLSSRDWAESLHSDKPDTGEGTR